MSQPGASIDPPAPAPGRAGAAGTAGTATGRSGGGGSRVASVRRGLAGVLDTLPSDADEALDAASRCFTRAGVDHTSVPDIARELGVSRATVYRKLGTTDDIAWALFVRDLDRALAGVDGRAGVDRVADAVLSAAPGHSLTGGRRHDEPYLVRELLPRLQSLLPSGSDDLDEAVVRAARAASGDRRGSEQSAQSAQSAQSEQGDPLPPAAEPGGDEPDAAGAPELQERLLDAAEACFRRYGLANTTIEDVVREANVPRATLYRHAGGKAELLAAVLRREVTRFLEGLGEFVATCDGFASQIVDGTLFAVDMGRREPFGPPLAASFLSTEQAVAFEPVVAPVRAELWAQLTEFVTPLVAMAQETGDARPGLTAEDATEWLQRCIRSLIDAPDVLADRSHEQRRAFLERMLLPAFVPDDRR